MSLDLCPVCGTGVLRPVRGTYETEYVGRDGVSYPLNVPNLAWCECASCGEAILDEAASTAIEAARCKAQGLLSPGDIKAFRVRLEKTQLEMSQLLGIGEKTYCRWESGAYTQSVAFDRYLRVLMEVPATLDVLERLDSGQHDANQPTIVIESTIAFPYLRGVDIDSLRHVSDLFTERLENGELYMTVGSGSA